jgi:hypothetical protein
MESGTFQVTAVDGPSIYKLGGTFGVMPGLIRINGGTSILASTGTESGPDPVQSISTLTIQVLLPEPASFAMFGMGAIALLARRRRM